jgi:hypothetical protein
MDETVTIPIPILSDIPTDAEVADALDEAATVIETNGLMHDAFFDRPAHDAEDGIPIADCSMDAHGAITFVTCGHPVIWMGATTHQQRMRTAAVHALSAQLGEGFIDLPGWCEYAADEDVTTAMRGAATRLRGEGA